jgi:hypothetical protein
LRNPKQHSIEVVDVGSRSWLASEGGSFILQGEAQVAGATAATEGAQSRHVLAHESVTVSLSCGLRVGVRILAAWFILIRRCTKRAVEQAWNQVGFSETA